MPERFTTEGLKQGNLSRRRCLHSARNLSTTELESRAVRKKGEMMGWMNEHKGGRERVRPAKVVEVIEVEAGQAWITLSKLIELIIPYYAHHAIITQPPTQ